MATGVALYGHNALSKTIRYVILPLLLLTSDTWLSQVNLPSGIPSNFHDPARLPLRKPHLSNPTLSDSTHTNPILSHLKQSEASLPQPLSAA
ncbi:hypothetical protein E4U14_000649, partial [Claviceps sp. LM454 group G7]